MANRFIVILLLCFSILTPSTAQPKYETRAAWLTTAYGLDWPHTKADTPQGIRQQKEELVRMLDTLANANFNTVLFQTRIRGNVIYPSSIEGWSEVLTGKPGKNPGYDPLAFAIEECHKRGLECHAWIVTFPLGDKRHMRTLAGTSALKKHKDICVLYKNEYYLNPGNPYTKQYLMQIIKEIVTKYDIDGIHLDYLRYPEHAENFPDRKEYRQYGKGLAQEAWRRENLTETVRHIYNGIKQIKPWVKVSSSPVGKYRDTTRYPSNGWNAYHAVYQDPQKWLAEGIQDQIYPMIYFRNNDFYPFVLDWQEHSYGRHVIPGLGIYFLQSEDGRKEWNTNDIRRQVYFMRRHHLSGASYYRTQYLADNTKGVTHMLKNTFYVTPALTPPMKWIDSIPPTQPRALEPKAIAQGYVKLGWEPANDNASDVTYVVYASDTYPVDTSNPGYIVAKGIRETTYIYAPIEPWKAKTYFTVTAVDRCGNESTPASGVCHTP